MAKITHSQVREAEAALHAAEQQAERLGRACGRLMERVIDAHGDAERVEAWEQYSAAVAEHVEAQKVLLEVQRLARRSRRLYGAGL